jgi:hypothetical protein
MSDFFDASNLETWEGVEQAVCVLFGDRLLARAWLDKKMVRYGGKSPAEAWVAGEQESVRQMILQAAAGFTF